MIRLSFYNQPLGLRFRFTWNWTDIIPKFYC